MKAVYTKLMEDAEFNRFGIMSLCILGNTGFGAIVCYYVMSTFGTYPTILLCTSATILPNILSLAVAPMKQVIWGNLIGLSVNLLLLLAIITI